MARPVQSADRPSEASCALVEGMSMAVRLAPPHRFTRDEYYRMVETGILKPDARVELIEGEILEMSPIGRRHMAAVDRLTRVLVPGVGDTAIVRVQGSIALGAYGNPEPDIVLL